MENQRLLLAVTISILIVFGYQIYIETVYPPPEAPPGEVFPEVEGTAPAPPVEVPPGPPVRDAPSDAAVSRAPGSSPKPAVVADVRVKTEAFTVGISQLGGRIVNLGLERFRETVDPESDRLEMIVGEAARPLGLVFRGDETTTDAEVEYTASRRRLVVDVAGGSGNLELRGELADGTTILKRLEFDAESHAIQVEVEIDGPAAGAREVAIAWPRAFTGGDSGGWVYEGGEALVGRKLLQFDEEEASLGVILPDPKRVPGNARVEWAGYSDSYFLSALAPNDPETARVWIKLADGVLSTEVLHPVEGPVRFGVLAYAGPIDTDHLAAAGHNLSRALDLGWFSFVAEPLLWLLKFFHRATGNYGVDIILLTVLIKIAFWPLTQKSYQSMQALQKLQPEMKKIQERFADDKAKMNQEVMELYRRHKVNPLGGCLPMLLQMPVFFGLYKALLFAVELRHAPFALWINDLSAPDRIPAFPADPLGMIAGVEIRIPVLTLLMGASMFVQQRMTPQMGDPAQQRIMMLMPVIFTVMFVSFPSGLVLYWLVNNILTIAQQALIQRNAKKATKA